jgi:deferrochelatase/peroxidase EfeB
LCPEQDDPALGADPDRNNHFVFGDDLRGFKCPAGAHTRRANPRDALDHEMSVNVRLHRMLRRGTSYGPILPDGVLEDDGADRGIIFVFVGAHPKRQFEFVKTQWLNDGIFIGAPAEKDPLAGASDGTGTFTIPQRPIRRRLQSLPPFVITRGAETAEEEGGKTWQPAHHTPTAGRLSISARRRRVNRSPTSPYSSSTHATSM